MDRKNNFNTGAIIILLAISLIFSSAPILYAGGPQPGPKEEGAPVLIGKAVDGLLNVVLVDPADTELDQLGVLLAVQSPFVVQHIVIICKNTQIVLGPAINSPTSSQQDLAKTTAECVGDDQSQLCLEGSVFGNVVRDNSPLSECFPEAQEPLQNDLIITRVRNFINTGTAISAEISLKVKGQ